MAVKAYADGSVHNVLPFPRNAPVEHPRCRAPLDVTLLADYEVLRDDLKKLNADLAALKQQLGSLRG